jgi:hypothetical protein
MRFDGDSVDVDARVDGISEEASKKSTASQCQRLEMTLIIIVSSKSTGATYR